MQQCMLFGEGRNGEVFEIEDGARELRHIPDDTFPLGEILFTINQYRSGNGDIYLFGYHEKEPSTTDIEDAILRFNPAPI